MCGITGGWWLKTPKDLNERIACSLNKLKKRGPNDHGSKHYASAGNGYAVLGHTRLSIIDLSAAGHQPMISRDGRHSIVFNGEIYNYRELRQELIALGYIFSSDSDTEVLLAAWQAWNTDCLTRLEGMFAFSIYDTQRKTLSCARDAFGMKPLFYDLQANRVLFASELSALLSLRDEKPQANWQRCYDYLVHGDTDSQQQSFIEGIDYLLPGHYLEIDLSNPGAAQQQCWWRPAIEQSCDLSFDQAADAVREQFLQNIRLHLRSDVPLGAALSGGIDSSAVVCAMRYVEPDLPLNTFSFVTPGFARSEELWADKINQHVGAKAHKICASGADLTRDLDQLIQAQGEPFGSTNIYAHYLVCQRIREQGITVVLEGQGADELLAGYVGYPGHRLLSMLEQGDIIGAQRFASNWASWPGRSYGRAWKNFATIALSDDHYHIARRLFGSSFTPSWLNTDMMAEAGVQLKFHREKRHKSAKGRRVIEQLANTLQHRSLPSLLRHGDRSSMWFSVESRLPFLTLPMANLLLSMPEHYLISNNGETKSIFRAAMRGIVPEEVLIRRDKIGFETPEETWLLGMADTVREWLRASHKIPFLNQQALLDSFDAITSGKKEFSWQVWRWVNFIRWYEQLNLA